MDRERALVRVSDAFRRPILSGWGRFIVPLAVVGTLKILGFIMLGLYFRGVGDQIPHNVNMTGLPAGYPTSFPGLYLLTNWDSVWYLLIARYGYLEIPSGPVLPRYVESSSGFFPLSFNFFPGYPVLIRVLAFLIKDWILSASMISLLAGLCCIVVWQSIAEDRLTRGYSIVSTLITFLFPPVFFATTIAYSESLFLLMALCSWRTLTKNGLWKASAFAGLASIIRPYGVVVMIPVFLAAWKRRQWKDWAAVSVSLIPLLYWLAYGYERTSHLLAFVYARSVGWGYAPTTFSFASQLLAGRTMPSIMGTWPWLTVFDAFMIATLAILFFLLCCRTIMVDKELGVYGFVQYFIILVLGDWTSFLRFFGSIFPAWYVFLRRWHVPILVLIAFGFYLGSIYLWQQFLIGGRAP